jgi:hypothetical protein
MTQAAMVTKWKFVVEFEDDDTKEISGTMGQADTREECEGLIEYDLQYHISHERTVLNAEAVELCSKCHGDGQIRGQNGQDISCDACGGHLGPISRLTSSGTTSTNAKGRLLGQFPGLSRRAQPIRPMGPKSFCQPSAFQDDEEEEQPAGDVTVSLGLPR